LGPRIANWKPQQLFYIVKHGIKFTGMPAWPALGRDDEVRAVVAFLLELPKLDANRYRSIVHGDGQGAPALRAPLEDLGEPAPAAVLTSCARCHGAQGNGRGSAAFPKLAGQRRGYLLHALEAYAKGRRHSGIMQPAAAPLEAAHWAELAGYYAKLPAPKPEPAAVSAADLELGREIADRGIHAQGVPSCVDCHGPSDEPRNQAYPLLAGQYADYLVLQLELFKTRSRGGSPYAHIMENVASRLKPDQMRAVAAYYASSSAGARR
jgi:cytochrome c553